MPDRMKVNRNMIFSEMYVLYAGGEYNLIFETARSDWYFGRFCCRGQPTNNTQVRFTEMLCRTIVIYWCSSPSTVSVYRLLNALENITSPVFNNNYEHITPLIVLYILLNYLFVYFFRHNIAKELDSLLVVYSRKEIYESKGPGRAGD